MKKFYSLIFATFFFFSAQSQSMFSKVYWDAPLSGVTGCSVVEAYGSGYMIAGEVPYNLGGLLVKTDLSGTILFNKNYTVTGNQRFFKIINTVDSCYAVCGTMSNRAFCAKLNQLGDTIWTKSFQPGGLASELYDIQQTTDSGYVMTGFVNYSTTPYTKILVIKLSKTGAMQWSTILASGNWDNTAKSIKQTPDGGYIVTASVENNNPPFVLDAALIKLTATGTVSWSKKYNLYAPQYLFGSDALVVNNGIVVYVNTNNNTFVLLMKTDFSGNVMWVKRYTNIMNSNSSNGLDSKIKKTIDNKLMIYSVGSQNFGLGNLIKADTSGNIIWARDYMFGGADVIATADSGYYALGNGPMYGVSQTPPGSPQIGAIKTDNLGYSLNCVTTAGTAVSIDSVTTTPVTFNTSGSVTLLAVQPVSTSITFLSFNGCVTFLGGENQTVTESSFVVSPNPSSGIFTIMMEDVTGKMVDVKIYNVLGEKVFSSSITNNSITINLSEAPKGIYFVRVSSGDKFRTQKIVIQ